MINYLHSEWYQLTHRKSPLGWILVAGIASVLLLTIPLIISYFNSDFPIVYFRPVAPDILIGFYSEFIISSAPFLIIGICGTAFNNELKNRTFVNSVSTGFSRTKIYLAKFISSLFLCSVCLIFANLVITGLGLILYPAGIDAYLDPLFVDLFLNNFLYFTMFVALYTFIHFISSGGLAVAIALAGQLVVSAILSILAIFSDLVDTVRPYIFTELNPRNPILVNSTDITQFVILAYIILFLLIGIWYFNRKEIK